MAQRSRIAIPFGFEGIDRSSGRLQQRPGALRDARNVYLLNGKILVRGGMEESATFVDENGVAVTHIGMIGAQRTERVGIVIGYQQATGKVYVYRTTSLGTEPELLRCGPDGRRYWFQMAAGSDMPRITWADTYGRMFLAHDEPSLAARAQTVYYDPTEGDPIVPLHLALHGDDDPDDPPAVYFRGVARHLAYLMGWGFNSDADPDHPNIIRVSKPANPLEFDKDHYFLAGQGGEPVLNVIGARGVAVVLKESELHRIVGEHHRNFGIVPLDPHAGVIVSRLACPFDGGVAFWSGEGPRWTDGNNPSVDMAMPLDLEGLEPGDLIAAEDVEYGFSFFDPVRRILEFAFGQRAYALSVFDPQNPKWSYIERAVPIYCAGTLYHSDVAQGGSGAVRPTGYPKFVATSEWDDLSDYFATAKVEHVGALGGEVLEVWLKEGAGAWDLYKSQRVNVGQVRENVTLSDLTPDVLYTLAYRYRSGGLYTAGYEGDTPDAWTALTAPESKGTFTTTLTARKLLTAIWQRVDAANEKVVLNWEGGPAASDTKIQKATASTGPWTDVTDGGAVPHVAAGVTTYDYVPVGGEEETYLWFRVVATSGGVDGTPSNARRAWVGPQQPLGTTSTGSVAVGAPPEVSFYHKTEWDEQWGEIEDPNDMGIVAFWTNANASVETEFEYRYGGAGAWSVLDGSPFAVGVNSLDENMTRDDTQLLEVRMRHKLTTGATIDFSDYSEVFSSAGNHA